ncbi:hypothetical protein JCM8547_005154 [Rhodosporidiobolus lusitaniae]
MPSSSSSSSPVDSPLHSSASLSLHPDPDPDSTGHDHDTSFASSGPPSSFHTARSTTSSANSSSSRFSQLSRDSDADTITPFVARPSLEASSWEGSTLPMSGNGKADEGDEGEEGGYSVPGTDERDSTSTQGAGNGGSRLRWEDNDRSSSDEEDDDLNDPGPLSPSDDLLTRLPSHSPSPDRAETAEERRERRRRERRVYGGGRHRHGRHGEEREEEENDEGGEKGSGDMGVGEVAGLVVGGSLSPTPLLLPFACARLGPALFVPLLALAAGLAWLSAVVIGAEGRYVGARSFPALASAVFPHRFKLHLLGELLAVLFVLLGSIVRTALDVVAAAEVAVDLLVTERRRRDWEREVAVGVVCAVWYLVPLILPPLFRLLGLSSFLSSLSSSSSSSDAPLNTRYTRLSSTSTSTLDLSSPSISFSSGPSPSSAADEPNNRPKWTALLRLPAWSLSLTAWPLALLILGVRLHYLNRSSTSSARDFQTQASHHLPSPRLLDPTDALGASLWPAMLLPFTALLGSAHETFFYLTSLARPSSTSTVRRRRQPGRSLSLSGDAAFSEEDGGGEGSGGTGAGWRKDREGKRNQYPLALALGFGLSFLIQLGWALVGALGLPHAFSTSPSADVQLPSGDLLSDPRLPRADGWLAAVRVLVLVGVLAQVQGHVRLGIGRFRRALTYSLPSSLSSSSSSSSPRRVRATRFVCRLAVWLAVAALAWLIVAVPRIGREQGEHGRKGPKEVGGHGTGLVYASQWVGVLGAGVGGCLGPALAYLTLFHLRAPRTIFTASPSSPMFTSDALLQRKERQLQRRLSGRRVWTDVGVFGLLGPVGVVLVGRGVWALVSG